MVNFATDDPFNPAVSTRQLIQGIPCYDLYVSTKRAITDDVRQAGCKNVIYCPLGYDPEVHFPEPPGNESDARRFASDVVFIGGADPDRRPTMRYLASKLNRSYALTFMVDSGTEIQLSIATIRGSL